jgi:regulatory protein
MKIEWKEDKRRILLFRDGEEVRALSPRIVSARDLSGISAQSWEAFVSALSLLEEKGAMRLVLTALARRSYHSQQIRELLTKHFLSDQVIETILSFCQEKGYVNDQEWEEGRISYLRSRGKSARDISFRLRQKGIHASFAQDDQEVLKKLIEKKYPALLREGLPFKEKAKSIQALLRRGFSLEDIQKFLSDV